MAINLDTVVVGAPGNNGAAYVFDFEGGNWLQQARLVASDAASGDSFGDSVSLSGNKLVVGASLDDNFRGADAGAAYVFTRAGQSWTEEQKLTANNGAAGDHFGESVAIEGGTLVVGASNNGWKDDYPPLTGDVDGDGMTDLIMLRYDYGVQFVTILSNGDGTWQEPISDQTGWGNGWIDQYPVLTGDFNGDERTDMILRNSTGSKVTTALSQGDGTWSLSVDDSPGRWNCWFERPELIGDVDGDGNMDMVLFDDNGPGGTVRVLTCLADGGGGWSTVAHDTGLDSIWIDQYENCLPLIGNVNGDEYGRDDLILRSYQLADTPEGPKLRSQVLTLMSQGDGTWLASEPQVFGWGNGWFIQSPAITGDVDGNGTCDFLLVNESASYDNEVQVLTFFSDGSGGWTSIRYDTDLPGAWASQYPALSGDFNGDARLDLILRTVDSARRIRTLFSDGDYSAGTGTWTQVETTMGWGSGWFNLPALTGDFDADDQTEFVLRTSGDAYGEDGLQLLTFSSPGDGNWTSHRHSSGYTSGDSAGAAYVFSLDDGTWTENARIRAGDAAADDFFGAAVALSGNDIVMGAYGDNGIGSDAGAAYVFANSDSAWGQVAKISARRDPLTYEFFGQSVAIDGDYMVVGTPYANSPDAWQTGSAQVFRRDDGGTPTDGSDDTWVFQGELTAGDAVEGDCFGYSVAISGDTVVVGAYGDDDAGSQSGAAYVFARVGSTWNEQAKLTAGDAAEGDCFGYSVAISGDTVVMGAYGGDDAGLQSGAAYVFARVGGTWNEQAKLTAGDAARLDYFGCSVAISGDNVVVGADHYYLDGVNSGSAYVFARDGGTWSQEGKLTANDAAADDLFGWCVAISGDTVVVGVVGDDDTGEHSGSAYVFIRDGSEWNQQGKLTAEDAAGGDYFGNSVALSGDTVVVGAYRDDDGGGSAGSVYVFASDGSAWKRQGKLTAGDAAAEDYFGSSVAISGGTLVVGAFGNDDGGGNSGSAYVFSGAGLAEADGVSDDVEDGAPNGGDGNTDGVPDSEQANVTSLPNAEDGAYVTIAAPEGTLLAEVKAIDAPLPDEVPPGATFPIGVFEYSVRNLAPGAATTVTLILPVGTTVNNYYKFGPTHDTPTPHWYEFLYDGTTGAEIAGNVITLHLVDGARGDDDLMANGAIVDPGTPAFDQTETPLLRPIVDRDIEELATLAFIVSTTDVDPLTTGLTFSLDAASVAAGMSIDPASGQFIWTPNESQGPGSFTVTVTAAEAEGLLRSDTETFSVTVHEVDQAPVLGPIGDQTVDEHHLLTFTAVATDADIPSDEFFFSLEGQPAGASITPYGEFTFTPTDAQGPASFTFDVVVSEIGSFELSDRETITITVNEVNESPLANGQAVSTDEDTQVSIVLTGDDGDLGVTQTLTYAIADDPTQGTLVDFDPATGQITYAPSQNYHGTDSFTFTVSDGDLISPAATVNITVAAANDTPAAVGAVLVTDEDTAVEIDLRTLVEDVETLDDDLTFTVADGVNGTVELLADGHSARFTPTGDYHGSAGFNYSVTDTGDDTSTAITVSDLAIDVTVNPVNDAPLLAGIPDVSFDEDGSYASIDLDAYYSDVETFPADATFEVVSSPAGVTVSIDADHVLTIVGDANFNGEGDITIRVTDTGDGASAALTMEDTLHMTVNPVNDAPMLVGIPNVAFNEDGSDASIDLDAHYSDVETLPDDASFEVVSAPAGVTVSVDADHVLTIAGDANFNGEGNITIRVTDTGDGTSAALSAEDTLHVTVTPINDAPLLADIPDVGFDEDGSDASVDLDAYYSDVETLAGEATFEVVSAFGGVVATIDPVSHVLTITGDANFNGEGDITIRVTDTGDRTSAALTAEDTLHVTVTPDQRRSAASRHSGRRIRRRRFGRQRRPGRLLLGRGNPGGRGHLRGGFALRRGGGHD